MTPKLKDQAFIKEYNINDHKIMTMEAEKRERFIQTALEEFGKGYDMANTDVIAQKAGISKGLIFHYFGSKRGLFLFLLKYAADVMTKEYDKVILPSKDFLENIRVVSWKAMELTLAYPLQYRMLAKAVFSLNQVFPEGLPKDIPNSNQQLLQHIIKNSDHSMLRDDIDREKACHIVIWVMRGFSDSLMKYGEDLENYTLHYDTMMKDFEGYVALLRKVLYKDEHQ